MGEFYKLGNSVNQSCPASWDCSSSSGGVSKTIAAFQWSRSVRVFIDTGGALDYSSPAQGWLRINLVLCSND